MSQQLLKRVLSEYPNNTEVFLITLEQATKVTGLPNKATVRSQFHAASSVLPRSTNTSSMRD